MTPHQLRALDVFREYADAGFSPTAREVGLRLSLSTSTARDVLNKLVESGHLNREHGKRRGLSIAGRPDVRLASTDALTAELARRGQFVERRAPQPRASRGRQSCAADTCGIAVPRGHLFCRTHWFKLPRELQSAIMGAFRAQDVPLYQELVGRARDIADNCGSVM